MPQLSLFDICIVCMNELRYDARALNFARALAHGGFEVCIIAFGSEGDKIFKNEKFSFFRISPMPGKRAAVKMSKFSNTVLKFRKKIKARYILAADFYSLYAGKKLAESWGADLYYDSREIYSALGSLQKNPFKQKVIAQLEKRWVKNVKGIIVSGSGDADYLKQNLAPEKEFHTIMNLPPYRSIEKKNLIRDKYKLSGQAVIMAYQGMLSEGRGIFPAIRALPFFEDLIFVLFGSGALEDKIKIESSSLNVSERVILHGDVPYDSLMDWTASADIGLCYIEPITLSYKMALPNKLFEYAMAGAPPVVSDLPAMRPVLEEFDMGALVSPNAPPKQLADEIKALARPEIYRKKREACAAAAKKYNYDSQTGKILSIFK